MRGGTPMYLEAVLAKENGPRNALGQLGLKSNETEGLGFGKEEEGRKEGKQCFA